MFDEYEIPLDDVKAPFVTIEEMEEILKGKTRKDSSNGWEELKLDTQTGLYYTTYFENVPHDLVYSHLLVEQMMEMSEQVDWARVTYGYNTNIIELLEDIYRHPLVWMTPDTYEVGGEFVVLGRVAKAMSCEERFTCFPYDMFFNDMRGKVRVLWFADNLPVGDCVGFDKGFIRWNLITEDEFARHISDEEAIPEVFNIREFLLSMSWIEEERGGAKAAEIIRKFREDWPDIIAMKLFHTANLTNEQKEDFRQVLFEGMDRNMRKWEDEQEKDNETSIHAKVEFFPLLTDQCRKENKCQAVEDELRNACMATAIELCKTISINEALGYLPTRDWMATRIYRAFCNHFGQLPYNERNFREARNKIKASHRHK